MKAIAERDIQSSVVSHLTRRLVPFLFLLYIVNYLDRINVGFAALQMQQQLGFSDKVYGLGAGIFFCGYFCFQVPSNLMLNRVGARRWIALLMLVWGFISSATALVSTAREFYALRFLLGLAEAGFFPGMILYLKNWFPAAARARTVALFMTAAPLSGVVGGPISGALLGMHNVGGLAGWQWLFLMEGAPAVVLGVVVVVFLADNPRAAEWLPAEQREWLLDALDRERPPQGLQTHALAAFRSGRVWLLSFVYFALATCSYGISLWLPKLIRSLSGVSDFAIGLLSAIPYIAAAVAMVLVGLHSDRTGERRWHVALSAFTGAAASVAAAYSTSIVSSIAAISVALLAVYAMMGPFWALSTSILSGTAAAAGIAVINSIGNMGGFFGPYVIGWLRTSTGQFRGGLIAVGLTLAVGGCVAVTVRHEAETRHETEARET